MMKRRSFIKLLGSTAVASVIPALPDTGMTKEEAIAVIDSVDLSQFVPKPTIFSYENYQEMLENADNHYYGDFVYCNSDNRLYMLDDNYEFICTRFYEESEPVDEDALLEQLDAFNELVEERQT